MVAQIRSRIHHDKKLLHILPLGLFLNFFFGKRFRTKWITSFRDAPLGIPGSDVSLNFFPSFGKLSRLLRGPAAHSLQLAHISREPDDAVGKFFLLFYYRIPLGIRLRNKTNIFPFRVERRGAVEGGYAGEYLLEGLKEFLPGNSFTKRHGTGEGYVLIALFFSLREKLGLCLRPNPFPLFLAQTVPGFHVGIQKDPGGIILCRR